MPLETQLGVKDESTYGTDVVVDRFFEYTSENVKAVRERLVGSGLRASHLVQRKDRVVVVDKGAAGPIVIEPLSVGFGFWLKHMFGAVSSGSESDSVTAHTATLATLKDDSFTAQANRYDDVSAANRAFTWAGGKVPSWELSNSVDGILRATLNCDFESETTGTALASASYPTGGELFSWAGGAVTIGGSSVPVTDVKVAVDNAQKTDRYAIRGSTQKLQPVQNGWRKITWECTAYWDSMTQYNRFASATASGAFAAIVATWTGPTLVGTSSYPSIAVTVDEARFDSAEAFVAEGGELIMQKLSGVGMYDGTNAPLSLVYTSADATP